MALVAAIVVGLTVLDGAARWLVIACGALVEVGEATAMIRYSRRRRPAVGSEALVGRQAVVAVDCDPAGQVRIDGELWSARCARGCRAGERVTVVAVDGLTLTVEPASTP